MQFFDFGPSASILNIKVNAVACLGSKNNFKHVEIHFVIPDIVILAGECPMAEQGFVRDDQSPEMQVVIIKEIINAIQIKLSLCRGDFGPLDLKIRWKSVPLLDFPQSNGNLSDLLKGAPDGPQDHGFLMVVF
jgi:hypothetical protein